MKVRNPIAVATDWTKPRPDPVIPRGMTIYCQEPTTLHGVCPGYSIHTTEALGNTGDRLCACTCHEPTQ
jgi:hypothetical protein